MIKKKKSEVRLTAANCGGILADRAARMGWALCIGAGSSRGTMNGVFPEWGDLVDNLIKEDRAVASPEKLSKLLKQQFSLDALIQAAENRLGGKHSQFVTHLQGLLYTDLRARSDKNWNNIARGLTAAGPNTLKRSEWEQFLQFFDNQYPHLSALQVARVLADNHKPPHAPSVVISFNAETLLYALVNACRAISEVNEKPNDNLRMFNRVTRGISYQQAGRVPYIFCHGLMEIDGGLPMFAKSAATEKLVFSESEYIQLANSSFTWQSSLFLGTAVLRSIVFVGVSFSDPNLRRWLAWVHANRANELSQKGSTNPSYEHYWINRDPKDEATKLWTESIVRHLGVRLVWIENWEMVGDCLARMLTLKPGSQSLIPRQPKQRTAVG